MLDRLKVATIAGRAGLAGILLVGACAGPPAIQTGPDAEVTYDGLVRVDHSKMQYVWVDPDIDLSSYDKILPIGAEIQYRAVRQRSRSTQTEFPMTDAQKQRLETAVSEVFIEELSKTENYELTDRPGPGTLIVQGQLLDVVSRVPPVRADRGNSFIASVGQITLVLEIRDSQSQEILARGADRRAAQRGGNMGQISNTATNTAEVRRLARRWASQLREALDQLHSVKAGND